MGSQIAHRSISTTPQWTEFAAILAGFADFLGA